jgi:succinate dehydrogenase / fumarate reductase, iron-sulfur subunit
MNFTLRIWRQQSANASGKFANYQIKDVTPEMSFLEMLDALNEDLINRASLPLPSSTIAGRGSAARAVF